MVDLLSEYDLDIMKLINLIAKLKAEGNDADEDDIIQSLIVKMLETNSRKQDFKKKIYIIYTCSLKFLLKNFKKFSLKNLDYKRFIIINQKI